MHFSKIEVHNFGIYTGTHNMILGDKCEDKNICLIGGMNGRGKTTILNAIFLCLYGKKSVSFISGKKTAFDILLKDHINKSATDDQTYIQIDIELDDEASSKISIKRSWTLKKDKVLTTLIILKNEVNDDLLSKNWDYYVEELIPYGIAKFFFFDNEKITDIADDDKFETVKDSIKSLMGITAIDNLKKHMKKIIKDKSLAMDQFNGSKYNDELLSVQADLNECEKAIEKANAKLSSLTPKLQINEASLISEEELFWKAGGDLSIHKAQIEDEKKNISEKLELNNQEALSLAGNPSTPLLMCKSLIQSSYNTSQDNELEKAKRAAEKVLTPLYEGIIADCIAKFSGSFTDIDELKKIISDNFLKYVPKDNTSIIENISAASKSLLEHLIIDGYNNTEIKIKDLCDSKKKLTTAQNQLDAHLSSEAENTNAEGRLQKIKELQIEHTLLSEAINKLNNEISTLENKQEILLSQERKLIVKIAQNANSNDEDARVLEYASKTIDVMEEFARRLQAAKVQKLQENISNCFKHLASKENIISAINIDPQTLDITLYDYQGGILLKDQLSAGEKQMFAIAIHWGLAITSGYDLPVVIDTPMGRLDSAHRMSFVEKYLPMASTQVLVLSTDEEVYGKYLNAVKPYINCSYTIQFHPEEKNSSIEAGYFGGQLS